MYTPVEGEYKYHVANIMPNMANSGQTVSQFTSYASSSGAFNNVLTDSTTILTPTTLSNLEETFIELQSYPSRTMVQNPVPQSGFVPPIVYSTMYHGSLHGSDHDMYSDMSDSNNSNSCDDYLPSQPKKIKIGDKTTTIMPKYQIENPQRKTHRRQIREDDITPEEAARRDIRRERNKFAAAKCRQKHVDHTNRLLCETEKLVEEQHEIELEIQKLLQQKEQLEFILQSHNPICKSSNSNSVVIKVKKELEQEKTENLKMLSSWTSEDISLTSRPQSLSISKLGLKNELVSVGVTLTTPSNGFYSMTLDSMVDHTGFTPLTGSIGHTGFTPITSMPQSCGSEMSKKQSTSSESSDGMKSPSNLITL